MNTKIKILVCGILPPPNFGHSMMYKILMESDFVRRCDVIYLDMKFWSYGTHNKVTLGKLWKMVQYVVQYVYLILRHRPRYVLFNMSFYKMPFLKDYLFCLAGYLCGCRIVLHDMGQYLPELMASSGRVYNTLVTHLLKMTTAIIVMGEKVKTDYAPHLSGQEVMVVPGSVEDTVALDVPRLPRGQGQIRVLYFSFLSVSKGLWTALKAIPLVIAKNPQVFFQFGGPIESEALHQEMKAFIAQNNLSNHVEYIGYVPDTLKRTECFRNSDIFIFPTHRDVFGLVLLHAMAESVPVVASREGTIPEIIIDGKNGFLFPKGDHQALAEKILVLAKDAQLRKTMGQANRERYLAVYAPDKYGAYMTDCFQHLESINP